jgi:superfamily I DNA/RNA helicase/mRNA-degrading endonuclease RelE of RelBE toxin-antitoxin system
MTTRRELNLKPAFLRELNAFPAAQTAMLWEKIGFLVDDPLPDGKLKKKLVGKDDLYRLRVGDHRLFYTFGESWIRLLAIRKRDDRTYRDGVEGVRADAPEETAPPLDDDALDAALARDEARTFRFDAATTTSGRPLPRAITRPWLEGLQVPAGFHDALLRCTSEDALLDAPVPAEVAERVLDALFPRPLAEVARQPDLVVRSTNDLVRYAEGELIAFLLKLDPAQERLTRWALKGPTLVKGGAGTGKSTVALYRVRALLERKGARADETVLFTTYTRALERATSQLLDQLLPPESRARVRVTTCDTIAREVVAASRKVGSFADTSTLRRMLRDLRATFEPAAASPFERKLRAKALARLSDDYLLEEFEWVIEGRDLATLDEYLAAPRPGRGVVLGEKLRAAVWELRAAFQERLATSKLETFPDLRREALTRLRAGLYATRFDHVLVDEAQDLSPASLALLAELAATPEGIFLAADAKQSLYSRNYTFASAHPRLDFRGRTALLARNYRSTAEIDRAAFSILAPEEGEVLEASESPHSGPLPVLARGMEPAQEGPWTARFLRQMAQHLRLQVQTGAVLVPDAEAGVALAQSLQNEGVAARYYPGRELDLREPVVKVLTLHSAKGLEFPMVVLAGLRPGTYPTLESSGAPEVFEEALRNHRRLLYVGMTRAMRGLLVLQPRGWRDPCLTAPSPTHWNLQEPSP